MATLYISEYDGTAAGDATAAAWYGKLPVVPGVALVEQSVAIGGASAQSSAFGSTTRLVQINCDTACSIAFGTNPTASATAHRMAPNETRFYAVSPGEKIAVITNT